MMGEGYYIVLINHQQTVVTIPWEEGTPPLCCSRMHLLQCDCSGAGFFSPFFIAGLTPNLVAIWQEVAASNMPLKAMMCLIDTPAKLLNFCNCNFLQYVFAATE